jgi:hypothetical protein
MSTTKAAKIRKRKRGWQGFNRNPLSSPYRSRDPDGTVCARQRDQAGQGGARNGLRLARMEIDRLGMLWKCSLSIAGFVCTEKAYQVHPSETA